MDVTSSHRYKQTKMSSIIVPCDSTKSCSTLPNYCKSKIQKLYCKYKLHENTGNSSYNNLSYVTKFMSLHLQVNSITAEFFSPKEVFKVKLLLL